MNLLENDVHSGTLPTESSNDESADTNNGHATQSSSHTPRQSQIRTNPRATPTTSSGRPALPASSSDWILISKNDYNASEDVNNNQNNSTNGHGHNLSHHKSNPHSLHHHHHQQSEQSLPYQLPAQGHLEPVSLSVIEHRSIPQLAHLQHFDMNLHRRQLSADSAIKSNSTASSSPIHLSSSLASNTSSPVEWSQNLIMQCSDDEAAMLERNGSLVLVNEQLREIDEELEKITESIVDDDIEELPIMPIVTGNSSTIVLPSITRTTCSIDPSKPLITSMKVTRIGAVSPAPLSLQQHSPKLPKESVKESLNSSNSSQDSAKNPLKESPKSLSIVTQVTQESPMQESSHKTNNSTRIQENPDINGVVIGVGDSLGEEFDDDEDNIYDETPELSDLNDCLRITQPIWHLPHVDRATVVHYLQTKPVGVFIVRASSKACTLALSVRLPVGRGPHIEHYLIELRASKSAANRTVFSLEGSEHEFTNILDLVIHYAHCCDELPTPLGLPAVLCPPTPMTNDQRTSIASLALLGQEFWQSKIAQLKGTLPKESLTTETLTSTVTNGQQTRHRLSPTSSASHGSTGSLTAHSLTPTPRPRTSITSEHHSPTPLIGVTSTKIISHTSIPPPSGSPPVAVSGPPPLPPKSFPVGCELFEKPNLPPRTISDVILSSADAPPPLPPRPGGRSGSNLQELLLPLVEIETEMNQVIASLQTDPRDDPKANYVKPKKSQKTVNNNPHPVGVKGHDGRVSACDIYTQTPLQLSDDPRASRARASSSLSLTSSFYMDPVDAVAIVQQVRRRKSARNRYSDPELSSSREPSNILGSAGGDYSIFQPGHALGNIQSFDALLEKFRAKFATLESAYGSGGQVRSILMAQANGERIDSTHAPDGSGFYTIDSNWEWRDCNRSPDECVRLLKANRESKRSQKGAESEHQSTTNLVENADNNKRHSKSSFSGQQYDNLTKEEANKMKASLPPLPPQPAVTAVSAAAPQPPQKRRSSSKPDNNNGFPPANNANNGIKAEAEESITPAVVLQAQPAVVYNNNNGGNNNNNNNNNHDHFGSLDRTIALLNIDLINFNAFLQAQESQESGNFAPQSGNKLPKKASHEDDYDRVAEELLEAPVRLRGDDKKGRSKGALASGPARNSQNTEPVMLSIVENISSYVLELAERKNNTFAKSIDNFIQCTRDSAENSPNVILGYVRQFMNGMKNYLIKHGEAEFGLVVSRERARLRPDQFLNLDSILECALQALVIKPLKSHLYELCVRSYTRDGSLIALQKSIQIIQSRRSEDYGISAEQLPKIERAMRRLQRAYSPIAKLEQLLQVVSALNGSAKSSRHSFSGDALLPALQYAISHCALIYVEVELDYTLGLLHSSVLNGGDGNYYLALWSSAVEALRAMSEVTVTSNLKASHGRHNHLNGNGNHSNMEEGASMIRILIPDELTSSIACKSVPVRRNMTSRELCRMIGHTYKIANTENHTLYRVRPDGAGDIPLGEHESPQSIQIDALTRGEAAPLFAFKRTDAQFLWPTKFLTD